MRVVVAIDSFKGSLSSLQAGQAVKEAICRLDKDAEVLVKPLADGGEGTVDALAAGLDSQVVEITVNNPLMRPVKAKYCISNTFDAAYKLPLISPFKKIRLFMRCLVSSDTSRTPCALSTSIVGLINLLIFFALLFISFYHIMPYISFFRYKLVVHRQKKTTTLSCDGL